MNTIFKFKIDAQTTTLKLPKGAKTLNVGEQYDSTCVWILLNPELPYDTELEVLIFGTGHAIDCDISKLRFINTLITEGGALVWHFFERFV